MVLVPGFEYNKQNHMQQIIVSPEMNKKLKLQKKVHHLNETEEKSPPSEDQSQKQVEHSNLRSY